MLLAFGGLIGAMFAIFLNWRIAQKAGYPGGYSLLMLIPFVNVVAFIYFGLAEWPIHQELGRYKLAEQVRK